MKRSWGTAICWLLVGLTLWLVTACAGSTAATDTPFPGRSVRLYTRTPTPTVTPTPTLDPQFVLRQGLTQREAWNLEQALEYFNRVLDVAPSASVFASRAEVHRLTDRYEEATVDIERALDLDPESADAWRQKALLSRTREAWDEALDAVNKLVELEPEDGAAYVLRAEIFYEGFGNSPQALVDYGRAIDRDAIFDEATLVERWHLLAELERWEEALLISHRMIATGSEDPLRFFYRGWSLIQLGQVDAAIQALLFGIKRYPDYPMMLYYALGVAYYERGAWEEAIQALEVALLQMGTMPIEQAGERLSNISPSDILGPMGVAYLELRQCETGGAIVERAIAESPNPSDWLWARPRIEACYISLTPTPTPENTPMP